MRVARQLRRKLHEFSAMEMHRGGEVCGMTVSTV